MPVYYSHAKKKQLRALSEICSVAANHDLAATE